MLKVELIGVVCVYATYKIDCVFDGFIGSASTALACLRTNRKFIGFELDVDYFKVAQRRIKEEMFNQKDMFGYDGTE